MSCLWSFPPDPLTLASNEVHVWRAASDCTPSRLREFQLSLAEDEQRRAARFYFQKDRERFIVTRGSLRAILGKYIGAEPARLGFRYNSHGKPKLSDEFQTHSICFNVSHSRGLALFAVARGREVGVDVEWIRSGLADKQTAERFFSPKEIRSLRALDKAVQDEAFFNGWTRKEAYIKAKGQGLSISLDSFEVSLAPGEPAALLSVRETSGWSLRELHPGAGFVGAVAAEGCDWELKSWKWAV